MKIIFNLLLLLIMKVFIEARKKDKELNLNNDYQVKFERAELIRYNKDLLKVMSIVTFKYNRTIAVVNATMQPKVDLDKNIVGTVQGYKFMSNEYRPFPIRFSASVCKALDADVGGAQGFLNCGNFTLCPYFKGRKYHFCNWYPDQSKLPPFMPTGQYKLEVQIFYRSTELYVLHIYANVFRPITWN